MKLHEAEFPNARRVHVFMAEKGIDPRAPIDIGHGEDLTPECARASRAEPGPAVAGVGRRRRRMPRSLEKDPQ